MFQNHPDSAVCVWFIVIKPGQVNRKCSFGIDYESRVLNKKFRLLAKQCYLMGNIAYRRMLRATCLLKGIIPVTGCNENKYE
jgi:hypothetical protein